MTTKTPLFTVVLGGLFMEITERKSVTLVVKVTDATPETVSILKRVSASLNVSAVVS